MDRAPHLLPLMSVFESPMVRLQGDVLVTSPGAPLDLPRFSGHHHLAQEDTFGGAGITRSHRAKRNRGC
jgi:hypothetical protein